MKPAPTLSKHNWLESEEMVIDRIISWFIVTDQYQSTLYKGVGSLPGLIAIYKQDYRELGVKIAETLTQMFKAHFDDVDLDVSVSENPETGEGNIVLEAVAYSNGVRFPVDRAFTIVDSKVIEVNKENESY